MKYKLIKEYPGSPKLGNTIDNLENDWIEDYPEFWEEVVKKVKIPLFTSEDGVNIFEGDISFGVNSNFKLSEIKHINKLYIYPNVKEFSTKEKAEEYILYNKPLLTLKDIEELLCKNTSSYFLEKFKKRAQKLNNKN